MGNSSSSTLRLPTACIRTSGDMFFNLSYWSLVDHALLLRQVIAHPEMTKEGETLDYFIKEYCHRMLNNQMSTRDQQSILP
jgi:hypothetical protein